MPQQTYDPSSKWLLEEHGAGILYLAGERHVLSCTARKAEVVQPRQLPDGLLEVRFADRPEPSLVLVEVATYPEQRVVDQVTDDIRLVRQAREVLPEALVLCLRQRGTYRVPQRTETKSTLGWTTEALSWKVVEMWTLSAEELLAAPDLGVVTLATLARYDGPPEVLLQRCRDRIDREGGRQRGNLLAVAQVLAQLNFNRPEWLEILGGKTVIESPLIQEIGAEFSRTTGVKAALAVLKRRFGTVPPGVAAGLELVKQQEKLIELTGEAAVCASLDEFEQRLSQELPAPPPVSTRGKRRSRKPSAEG
jgi:hypothetical protein